jgi:hypothetical protein
VSKLKTPGEKKSASLSLDGRNIYGENDKSSRKAIPLRKQLSHQEVRRASKPLTSITSGLEEDELVAAEAKILATEIGAVRSRFRKRPDEPLGAVIKGRQTGDRSILKRKRK